MAKLNIVPQSLFAGSAVVSGNVAQIGSTAAGAVNYSNDPATIQALSRFGAGLRQQIRNNNSPVISEQNALFYLFSYAIAALQQHGVPQWNAGIEYFAGSISNDGAGNLFRSKQNANVNHALTDGAWWEPYSSDAVSTVKLMAGGAPAGWIECNGAAVSRTTYSVLFGVIGTTFGVGDGSNTFNLPDLRGRVPVGLGTGDAPGATNWALGRKTGEETHQLIESELPNVLGPQGSNKDNQDPGPLVGTASVEPNGTYPAEFGSNTPHNNLQPSLGMRYVIKT